MLYFFHVEDGICVSDPKGQEFPDDTSAMLEAARVAEGLSGHLVKGHPWHVLVKNADGVRIGQVPLTLAPIEAEVGDLADHTFH
jgi:hypothetical protein